MGDGISHHRPTEMLPENFIIKRHKKCDFEFTSDLTGGKSSGTENEVSGVTEKDVFCRKGSFRAQNDVGIGMIPWVVPPPSNGSK